MSELEKHKYDTDKLNKKGEELKLKKDIEDVENQFKNKTETIEKEVKELAKTSQELQTKIALGKIQLRKNNDLVTKLKEEIKNLPNEIKQKEDQIKKLVEEIENLPNEIKQNEASVDEFNKQYKDFKIKLEEIEKERDAAIERVRKGQY